MSEIDSITKQDSGIPLYLRLADVLRHKIADGVWAVGELIPPLHDLSAEYKLARSTVRRAIGTLIDERLLKSGRGIGTVVVNVPKLSKKHLRSTINDISSPTGNFQIKIISAPHVADIPDDLLMDRAAAGQYLLLKKIHIHKGNAFVLMHIYILKEIFDRFPAGAEQEKKLAQLVYEYSPFPISHIHQTITVEPADALVSTALNYGFSAPVAKVIRHFPDAQGRLVYCGVFWYRGDGFIMDMQLPGNWLAENQAAVAPNNKY